jgi:hypothetical protein
VGRTNVIVLVMGGLAVVALSMLMQYSLRMQQERATDPVLQELMELFGPSLERETRVAYPATAAGRRAVLEIHPRLDVQLRTLALRMGEMVWRRVDGLVGVEVVCHTIAGDVSQRIDVPRPFLTPR